MANVIWNALRSVSRCHLLGAVVSHQSKSVEILILCDYWCQHQSPLGAAFILFAALGTQTGVHLSLSVSVCQRSVALNPHDLALRRHRTRVPRRAPLSQ